jgi:hypothetical protein
MPTEADTCRKFVVPKLQAAGWDTEPYSIAEQRTITDGRIVAVGKGFIRRAQSASTTFCAIDVTLFSQSWKRSRNTRLRPTVSSRQSNMR